MLTNLQQKFKQYQVTKTSLQQSLPTPRTSGEQLQLQFPKKNMACHVNEQAHAIQNLKTYNKQQHQFNWVYNMNGHFNMTCKAT